MVGRGARSEAIPRFPGLGLAGRAWRFEELRRTGPPAGRQTSHSAQLFGFPLSPVSVAKVRGAPDTQQVLWMGSWGSPGRAGRPEAACRGLHVGPRLTHKTPGQLWRLKSAGPARSVGCNPSSHLLPPSPSASFLGVPRVSFLSDRWAPPSSRHGGDWPCSRRKHLE